MQRRKLIQLSTLSLPIFIAGCTGKQTANNQKSNNNPSSAGELDVDIESFSNEIKQGEDMTVYFSAENTGDVTTTATIGFQVNESRVASQSDVKLAPDESYNDKFSYTTKPDDPPAIKFTVTAGGEETSRRIPVEPTPPVDSLDVSITDARIPSLGLTSVTIPILFTVENTDNNTKVPAPTVNFTSFINGTEILSDSVRLTTIEPGESVTEELDLLIKLKNYGKSIISSIKNKNMTIRLTGSIESEGESTGFDIEKQL